MELGVVPGSNGSRGLDCPRLESTGVFCWWMCRVFLSMAVRVLLGSWWIVIRRVGGVWWFTICVVTGLSRMGLVHARMGSGWIVTGMLGIMLGRVWMVRRLLFMVPVRIRGRRS